ncbi:MAG TPA: NrfD/PsrC family molybdoenzyme membrane anchor subunit [Candidatus Dormibacteraeota bacterium]
MPLVEHFARPPSWLLWILLYFFFAGLGGGAFVLGTLLRLWGARADQRLARTAFLVALPCVLLCPVFLTVDLGQPLRFWHMLAFFAAASPMSVGAFALLLFGVFAFVAFLDALHDTGRLDPFKPFAELLAGPLGAVFYVVGAIFGLFIAGYTGVLLSVSNQPVWSDSWALGGLFLVSGMSGAAALLVLLGVRGRTTTETVERLELADGWFALIELILLIVFLTTVAVAGSLGQAFGRGWVLLWALAILSLLFPILASPTAGRVTTGTSAAMLARVARENAIATAGIVLLGVLALRIAVLFSAQL